MLPAATANRFAAAALLVAAGMALTVGAAIGFEVIGGFVPCKLCLAQREPYYLGIPFAVAAFLTAGRGGCVPRTALAIAALCLAWTFALAVYHTGVEWRWWAGPADCGAVAGDLSGKVGDLVENLTAKRPPSCDAPAGRFLGLSFAGWNAVASLALLAIAAAGLRGGSKIPGGGVGKGPGEAL
jgi:disulfide bond formation protein DsbB